jgi:hypothetical protein
MSDSEMSSYLIIILMIGWVIVEPICKAIIISSKNKKEDK